MRLNAKKMKSDALCEILLHSTWKAKDQCFDDPKKKRFKSEFQLDLLWQISGHLTGKITSETRRFACQRTGLKWKRIYKWAFDNGLRFPRG